VDLGSIAERQAIPETYLAKLVVPLRSAGIIRSARGAKGGYELARSPDEIKVSEVVEVLEGRASLLECTDHPELCARSADCPTLPIWTGLEKVVRDYLESVTVGDAAAPRAADYSI
jgi:Rrf2 family protein